MSGSAALIALLLAGCSSGPGQSAARETAAVRLACHQVSQLVLPPPSSSTGAQTSSTGAQIEFYASPDANEIRHSGNAALSKLPTELERASSTGNAKSLIRAIDRAKALCHSLAK
jgi:hypothetical protein